MRSPRPVNAALSRYANQRRNGTILDAHGTNVVHIHTEMPPSRCFPVEKRTVDSGVGWRISMEK